MTTTFFWQVYAAEVVVAKKGSPKCKLDTAIELYYHFVVPNLIMLCVFYAPGANPKLFNVPVIMIVGMQFDR
jgi:hypothetical protein